MSWCSEPPASASPFAATSPDRPHPNTPEQEPAMHTSPQSPSSHVGHRAVGAVVVVAASVLLATGCAGNLVHRYRSFQSALDRGASCSELFDPGARFETAG